MSINPGTNERVSITDPVGTGFGTTLTQSLTMNPPTPIEYGRTVSGGIEDDATEADSIGAG